MRYEIQEVRYIKGGGPLSGQTFGFDVDGKTFPTYAEAKGHADRLLLTKPKPRTRPKPKHGAHYRKTDRSLPTLACFQRQWLVRFPRPTAWLIRSQA